MNNEQQLKKEIQKFDFHGRLIAGILFIILAVVTVLVGLLQSLSYDYETQLFTGYEKGESYLPASCVVGAFASTSDDSVDLCIVQDAEGYYYIAALPADHAGLPELGVDVDYDTEFNAIDATILTGYSTVMTDDMISYLQNYMNYDEEWFSEDDIYDYFGDHYLDTTADASGSVAYGWFILGAVALLIGILLLISRSSGKKKILQKIQQLEQTGEFAALANNYAFSSGELVRKDLKLIILRDYILNFNAQAFTVLPLTDLKNVYRSRMQNGKVLPTNHLVFEFEDHIAEIETNMAYNAKANAKLDTAVMQIRSNMNI